MNSLETYQNNFIHQLFEQQAELNPEAVAITFSGKATTYAELNAESNRVAYVLLEAGVQANQPVALLQHSGPRQIAALMGILKAGGVFVCLDHKYPSQRLFSILEEISIDNPLVLVTDSISLSEHEELLPRLDKPGCNLVLPASDDRLASTRKLACGHFGIGPENQSQSENPAIKLSPVDPAYIVYTSGSTGVPKGIMQSHQSFSQFIAWQSRQFNIVLNQKFAQWASIGYDASYCEIFGALCFGATLAMAESAVRHDPEQLKKWVKNEKITILQMVPSFGRQFVQTLIEDDCEPGQHPLPDLELLLLAGEKLPPTLAHTWLNEFPEPPALVNLYGPSESVLATYYPVEKVDLKQTGIPIGTAIDGREILLLDENQQPCPVGVGGEIYIRSKFLTMGYYRQTGETQARYIQNPLHNDFPDPVYRTGDMGRKRKDGNIEFLGRKDTMIKLRGFRVELSEIEAVLMKHSQVKEAVVLARNDSDSSTNSKAGSETKLVAYVVTKEDEALRIAELRQFLKKRLPNFMVPAVFIRLACFPVNVNGKIDRLALPAPGQQLTAGETYVAPRNDLEFELCRIMEGTLGVQTVGVKDDFFDLGGHSLLAIRLLAVINKKFDVTLRPEIILNYPTVEQIAAIFLDQGWKPSHAELVAIQPEGTKTPIFCLPGIHGGVIYLRDLAYHLGTDRPFYGLRPQDLHGAQAPVCRMEEMAELLVENIRSVQPDGPYLLAGHSFGCTLAFAIAQKLNQQGQKVNLLAFFDYLDSITELWPDAESKPETVWFLRALKAVRNQVLIQVVKSRLFKAICTGARSKGRPLPAFIRFLAVLTAVNWQAEQEYQPGSFDGRVTLFQIEDSTYQSPNGLPQYATGGVEIHTVQGDHDSHLRVPYVKDLADKLNTCIKKAEAVCANVSASESVVND